MSGTANNGEGERPGPDQPGHQTDEVQGFLDDEAEFIWACTKIVQLYQTGQLTYLQGLVQIALKIADVGFGALSWISSPELIYKSLER